MKNETSFQQSCSNASAGNSLKKAKSKMSLQWQLTLMTALVVAIACLTLSFIISKSAVLYMDEIGDSVVAILPKEAFSDNASEKSDFSLDITEDLTGQIGDTQTRFWGKSILFTFIIVLIGSSLTYFIVGYALRPLNQLSRQVEEIQAKNMQQPIRIDKSSCEISRLTDSFNEMLQRLSEAFFVQRQFSANAAHELRTPLAVMQTKLEVLEKQDSPDKEEYIETLNMVRTQTARLSHVIDMLLEMTQLQSAERTDSISLAALTEEVLCDLSPLGEKNLVTLCQDPGDVIITGNDTMIYRAIYNLIENAIKYNRHGGNVTVNIKNENSMAKITVSDTGCGIPAEYHEKIFDPFFRVDKSRSRSMGGAGLGLALVKEIARLHGGDVRIVQSSSQGTQTELTLTAAK